ncbi:hypothetical protein V6N13_016613 [Hibiscus sabdariffa]|uniref:Uncharacterized protein n=2 Tax=Hibiscus sabdariffa TaxID=183260 RepID=A0ABR2BAI1_9ROSI
MASCQITAANRSKTHKHTRGKITNNSQHTLSLAGSKVWEGSQSTDFPKTIEHRKAGEFTHDAGSEDGWVGSIAAVAYTMLGDGRKWVTAWSNPRSRDSKVFTDGVDEDQPIDWDQIKTQLDKEGKPMYQTNSHGCRAGILIDPKTTSPDMSAFINPPDPKPAK